MYCVFDKDLPMTDAKSLCCNGCGRYMFSMSFKSGISVCLNSKIGYFHVFEHSNVCNDANHSKEWNWNGSIVLER